MQDARGLAGPSAFETLEPVLDAVLLAVQKEVDRRLADLQTRTLLEPCSPRLFSTDLNSTGSIGFDLSL